MRRCVSAKCAFCTRASRRPLRLAACATPDASQPKKSPAQPEDDIDDFEGLQPEEDWEVPGNPLATLSQNTEIGKAVNDACDELDHLGGLEADVLQQAQDVLKKFGYSTNVTITKPAEGESAQENDGQNA